MLWQQKLLLFPETKTTSENLNLGRGRWGCKREPQGFSNMELSAGDLLNRSC